jgi:alkylation response protein AidB-like acyl-CoA dehydrogenase
MNDIAARATPEEVRADVRAWLAKAWDPGLELSTWRARLVDARWAMPSWPERWYGRGLPAWADRIAGDELRAHGAVGNPIGAGMGLAAPTLLEHGSDELIQRLLRSTLTGELRWCQLFSEPGAGSDLAGASTRARLDGDEWVVDGQKVWTTSAHHADLALLLARTDPLAPKHHGLSYFVLPMHQPGVEVRPIRQMNGYSSFNEVFLTGARIPTDLLVGHLGDGWRIARTTLLHERSFATLRPPRRAQPGETTGRAVQQADAEAAEHFATYVWYPQRAGRADLVVDHIRHRRRQDDPLLRQQAARLTSFVRANEWTASRAAASRALGRAPGPEGSLGKLAASEVARRANALHSRLAGAFGMLDDTCLDPLDRTIAEIIVSTPAQSIAGGTDEIQKNILGERLLGLPKEPPTG